MDFKDVVDKQHLASTPVEQLQAQLEELGVQMPPEQLQQLVDDAILNVRNIVPPQRVSRYRVARHDPDGWRARKYGYTQRRLHSMRQLEPAKPEPGPRVDVPHEESGMRAFGGLRPATPIEVAPLPAGGSLPRQAPVDVPAPLAVQPLEPVAAPVAEPVVEPVPAPARPVLDQVQAVRLDGFTDSGESMFRPVG